MKFYAVNLENVEWLFAQPAFDEFLAQFTGVRKSKIGKRILDLMHDKPMTKESIDMVIEYIRECGK